MPCDWGTLGVRGGERIVGDGTRNLASKARIPAEGSGRATPRGALDVTPAHRLDARAPRARARYAIAILLVAASMLVWRELEPLWAASGGHVYLITWPAVIAAAWIGGLGPGLFATVLACGSILFLWIEPAFSFRLHEPGDALALAVFAGCGVVVSVLTEMLHRTLQREERLRRARESVLAIVAHDLRNPLQSILFAASSLRRSGAEHGRGLEVIERAGSRMDRLIRDLVDASVLDRDGSLSVVFTDQDLLPIVSEAALAAREAAASKSIVIDTDAGGARLPRVRCDRGRILQVLENLLANAAKFTPEGGRITLRVAMLGAFLRVEVTDTGPGIEPEHQRLVFVRHWSGRRSAGSAGLGLYIASGIVRDHGGRIWVHSEPGHGTSFFFTLPVAPWTDERGRGVEESARSLPS